MRIISGNFKGKKISLPDDEFTRPLRDLVKESIFNIIEHSYCDRIKINGSNILDFFSGSGSFGLECFSRGATMVTFIENHKNAIKVLKKNINSVKAEENVKIIERDCFQVLELEKIFQDKYDLIFIDPPYKEKKINLILKNIFKYKILKDNGIIILHRHKNDDVKIEKDINIIESRIYGISKIIFCNWT